ncbi:MAG: hypothetical protein KAI79_12065 [Bacteroidales bacterium]|nr:hypothetical protein [Bacteroidales bacterium]
MKAANFCYWLQGMMELVDPKTITREQLDDIQAHLKIVFKYDIDPSYGDTKHQIKLTDLHMSETKINC